MRVYWKWVIQSVPSLVCGLLMLLSTVTPRQARSNVETWLIYFGMEDVPPWLATKSIDTWIYWLAFVGFCVLANSDDSTMRNVEVKLTSLEKQPENFHAIGSHLKLRNDRAGATNCNVYPTKDPQYMDAVFVDVFRYFSGPEGYASLSVALLPEDMNRHISVDQYDVKVIATSESGEMAVADLAFTPRSDQIPEFRLLRMKSFPGR